MVEEKKGGGGKPEAYDPATGRYVKENGEYKNFDNFIEKRITTPYFNEHIKDKILKDKRYSLFVDRIETDVSEEDDKAGIDAKMFFKFNNNVATIDLKVMTSKLGLGEDIPDGYDFTLRKQDDYSDGKIVNATILKENLTDSYLISYYKSHREKKRI